LSHSDPLQVAGAANSGQESQWLPYHQDSTVVSSAMVPSIIYVVIYAILSVHFNFRSAGGKKCHNAIIMAESAETHF